MFRQHLWSDRKAGIQSGCWFGDGFSRMLRALCSAARARIRFISGLRQRSADKVRRYSCKMVWCAWCGRII